MIVAVLSALYLFHAIGEAQDYNGDTAKTETVRNCLVVSPADILSDSPTIYRGW